MLSPVENLVRGCVSRGKVVRRLLVSVSRAEMVCGERAEGMMR